MGFTIQYVVLPRRSVMGHEGEWVKTFDPPAEEKPPTPELLQPTNPAAFVARTVPDADMKIKYHLS